MGKNKFDVCLMNPPFQQSLGEKFLIKAIKISLCVCSVQPSNWLFGNRKNKELFDILQNKKSNIERIKAPGKYFDAGIGNDLSINYIEESNKSYLEIDGIIIEDLENIRGFSTDVKLKEFNDIIEPLYNKDNVCIHILNYDKQEYSDKNSWCCKIARIRGHKYGQNGEASDFYTLFSNDKNFVLNDTIGLYKDLIKGGKRSTFSFYIPFNNKQELFGFLHYCQSDFARTALKLLKISQNIISGRITRYIPWFDFSDPVFSKSPKEIDDYLFAKFNISDEIRKHIEEILPDYYGIR